MSDLFRKQVLEARLKHTDEIGTLDLKAPRSWTLLTLIIATFVLVLFILGFTVSLNTTDTVRGSLRYTSGEARIVPSQTGTIRSCNVRNGQTIKRNDPIATIETEQYLSEGAAVFQDEKAAIKKEISTLQVRLQEIQDQAALDRSALKRQRAQSQSILSTLRLKSELQSKSLVKAQERLAEAVIDREEGLLTREAVYAKHDAVSSLELSIIQTESELQRLASEIDDLSYQIEKSDSELSLEVENLHRTIARSEAELLKVEAKAGYAILSPFDGIATAITCRSGELVQSDQVIAIILPENSKLIGEVHVTSLSIGRIEVGQQVILRYDAFPYQTYGVRYATVTEVASATSEVNGSKATNKLYTVELALDVPASLSAKTGKLELKSGMEFTAEILLERERAYRWLLSTLSAY